MPTIGVRAGAIRGRAWVCAGLLGLLLTSCDDPVAALIGVTAVSTGPTPPTAGAGHSHRCSIPTSDLQNPAPGNSSYVTTTALGHTHNVQLSQSDLMTLNEPNGGVDVLTSDRNGDGASHTHRFLFTR